jgi:hypothetical protein
VNNFWGGFEKRAASKWEKMLKHFSATGKDDLVRKMLGGLSQTPYGSYAKALSLKLPTDHLMNLRTVVSNGPNLWNGEQLAAAARRGSREARAHYHPEVLYPKPKINSAERGSFKKTRAMSGENDYKPWSSPSASGDELVNISHGGTREHIERMLHGNSRGYPLEGSTLKGMQVSPDSTAGGTDVYYALNAQGFHGGTPAVLEAKIPAKYLQKANNSYEAGLIPENVKHLKDINVHDTFGDFSGPPPKTDMSETVRPFVKRKPEVK